MKYSFFVAIFILASCGAGVSDVLIEISSDFEFLSEGEGVNTLFSKSKNVPTLSYLKKYSMNDRYLSIWQGDSLQINRLSQSELKPSTYYLGDRFYIIDITTDSIYGPFIAEQFFANARKLQIKIHWEPETCN